MSARPVILVLEFVALTLNDYLALAKSFLACCLFYISTSVGMKSRITFGKIFDACLSLTGCSNLSEVPYGGTELSFNKAIALSLLSYFRIARQTEGRI
jgi:hypothetical protein